MRRPAFRRPALVVVAAVALPLAGGIVGSPALAAGGASSTRTTYAVPADGTFTVDGHGWGHGHGMSQYGAYGAAKVRGLSYQQILSFYYPGTTLAGQPPSTTVRVLLHGTSNRQLVVSPRRGQALTVSTDATGVAPCSLPDSLDGSTPVQQWRAVVVSTSSGAALRLQATTDGSTWKNPKTLSSCDPAWQQPVDGSMTFDDGGIVDLVRSGADAPYRGALRAAFTGSSIDVVDVVPMESYLRSVVPSEMPSSWSPAALEAQAVAARTYASYEIGHPKSKVYDVYDDTRDQMYVGVHGEAASTDAAVAATRDSDGDGQILLDDKGKPAFTQFSSSDGGWTVAGGEPYLPAQRDPYDGLVPSSVHSWSTSVSAAAIDAQFSGEIGSLRAIVITGRDGNGAWGGRVTTMTLQGSSGNLSLSGSTFRYRLGLRSEWFRMLVPPGAATEVTAHDSGTGSVTVGWQPPVPTDSAPVTGYRVVLQPGDAEQKVGPDARTATFTGLTGGTGYTATVAATSRAGRGPSVTVTTKVDRIAAAGATKTAVAVSRATWTSGGAGAVILVRKGGWQQALAAAPLAATRHAPLLLVSRSRLPGATRSELRRVLPSGGRVYLLGGTGEIGDGVRSSVAALGYRVHRIGGATAAATARSIANLVVKAGPVRSVVEVSAGDAVSAWAAGPVATRRHAVVLLTNGTTQAPETARWLAKHPTVTRRYAVGADAAQADPQAKRFTAGTPAGLATKLAGRFFRSPSVAVVAAPSGSIVGAVTAARAAVLRGPLLFPVGSELSAGTSSYVHGTRASIAAVDLVGDGLPYDDVESNIQAALLP